MAIFIFISSCCKIQDEYILNDYVIYNQIGSQLADDYHFHFYYPFYHSYKNKANFDKHFHTIMKIVDSYGVDTSNYKKDDLRVNVFPDSFAVYEFENDPIIKSIKLEPKFFNTGNNVAIIKKSDFKKSFQKNNVNYIPYEEPFIHTFNDLSRIYYNPETKTAFMIVSSHAGPLAGSIDRIEVKKINGAWKIINCKNLKVS